MGSARPVSVFRFPCSPDTLVQHCNSDVARQDDMVQHEKEADALIRDAARKRQDWKRQLVAVAAVKDKALGLERALAHTREVLNGKKEEARREKEEVVKANKVDLPPFQREIYVIFAIIKKVLLTAAVAVLLNAVLRYGSGFRV